MSAQWDVMLSPSARMILALFKPRQFPDPQQQAISCFWASARAFSNNGAVSSASSPLPFFRHQNSQVLTVLTITVSLCPLGPLGCTPSLQHVDERVVPMSQATPHAPGGRCLRFPLPFSSRATFGGTANTSIPKLPLVMKSAANCFQLWPNPHLPRKPRCLELWSFTLRPL